jgi:glycosyltransferase involved in cell wall biosynthesis
MKKIDEKSAYPRVSVICPFLNGEAFLAEAIESVIAQTFDSWELLLVDDGSGADATAIAKSYADRLPNKIHYLEHPGHVNRGATVSRNLAVRHARGEFIAPLDGDDVWLPSKLTTHVAIMDRHPQVGMVGGTVIYWSSWSNGKDMVMLTGHRQNEVIEPPDATLNTYPFGDAVSPCPSDILLRADLVRQVQGFEEDFIGDKQLYEDIAFLSKIYLATPIYFCTVPSLKYRQHGDSCVARVKNSDRYNSVRLYFLEWFQNYLRTQQVSDPRIARLVRHALRPYRSPRIHFALSMQKKIRNRLSKLAIQAFGCQGLKHLKHLWKSVG